MDEEKPNLQINELNTILAAMAQAVIHFDSGQKAVRVNPAAIDLLGFDPVGLTWTDLADITSMRHPDGSPVGENELPFTRALRGENITSQRFLLLDNKGAERVVLASISPLYIDNQVSGMFSVWQDVSEREQLVEQLEIEQSRLETMIENAPQGIIVADEEGRLVRANPAAEKLFGRPLPFGEDFQSHVALNICYGNGTPYEPRYLPLTCSALDGERMNNVELHIQLPDNQVRCLLANTAPIIDRKGNLNGAVGILQDITERKQSEKVLRSQAIRSSLLASLSHAFAEAGLDYHELLETIVLEINRSTGDSCHLSIYTEDGIDHYPEHFELEDKEISETSSSCRITGLLMVPLRAHGRGIGIMELVRPPASSPFNEEDQVFFQDLAERAALAIEDAQLYEREMLRSRELHALNQATTALLATIDLEALLAQILQSAQNAIPAAEQGILYLLNENNTGLEIRATIGCSDPGDYSRSIEKHAANAIVEKHSLLLNEIGGKCGETSSENEINQSVIIAPLMLPQRVLGALALSGSHPNLFTNSELHLLDSFAATATVALQNATLYAEVQRLATVDAVTGQFNRHKLIELGELEIHRFHRLNIPLAAIMFDLDHFKDINDRYGHSIGDFALHSVAQRCRTVIRAIDILGRYGGDEFAILLPYASLAEAKEIAGRIQYAIIHEPLRMQNIDIPMTISLGVAQAIPETRSLSDLLGRADSALYQAKQNGRNCISIAE